MKFLILLSIIISFNLNAAIPTVEGLFRNINNKDIDGTIVVMTFQIEEKNNQAKLNSTLESQNEEERQETLGPQKPIKKYVKLFLSIENPERIEYMRVEYSGPNMSQSGVTDVSYYSNVLEEMKNDKTVERELFFSIINMFALNDSRGISQFLSRYNGDYYSNKNVLNEKKVALYNQYKNYLEKINENEELKEELKSPFKPEDPEKSAEISKTLKDSMYLKSDKVFLYKDGRQFFWKVNLDSTEALFDNNNLKLKKLVFNNGGGSINVNVGEYILFDGIHELPKIVYFKDLVERIFKVRILKYKVYAKLTKTIQERYKEMNEELTILREAKAKAMAQDGKVDSEVKQPKIFFY